MKKSIIFHHPRPIMKSRKSGSQVRPFEMIKAFEKIGYEVELITGYSKERNRSLQRIKNRVKEGKQFSFAYSESHTLPSCLTEKQHFPIRPFVDFEFLYWAKRNHISIGLFYRDIYWRLSKHNPNNTTLKRIIKMPFFWFDWLLYLKFVDYLFLPSLSMLQYLPTSWSLKKAFPLPPGCVIKDISQTKDIGGGKQVLKLFYVGGITPPLYDLRQIIKCINSVPDVTMTISCRQNEWELHRHYYEACGISKVEIVHADQKNISKYYFNSDIFLMFRAPTKFSNIAMPVKLFEALGYGVPIITNASTDAGDFVAREGIGWVVSSVDKLVELLWKLKAEPNLIQNKIKRVNFVRDYHTWTVRARTAETKLLCL